MSHRKRKRPIPILLLWSKAEQRRFIDAVERVVSAAADLEARVAQLELYVAGLDARRRHRAPSAASAGAGAAPADAAAQVDAEGAASV